MTAIVDTALSPLLDARTALAASIETATGYPVYASKPAGVATPCIVLEGAGWVQLMAAGDVAYKMNVTCLYANQAGDLADGVEEMARLAYVACLDANCRMIEVPAPGAISVGNADYAGVQFLTTLPVTIREI